MRSALAFLSKAFRLRFAERVTVMRFAQGITSMGIGSSFFGPSVDPMHPNGVHEPPRKAIKQERNGETASLPFAKTDTASVTQGTSSPLFALSLSPRQNCK